jgi:hypothetical protein
VPDGQTIAAQGSPQAVFPGGRDIGGSGDAEQLPTTTIATTNASARITTTDRPARARDARDKKKGPGSPGPFHCWLA